MAKRLVVQMGLLLLAVALTAGSAVLAAAMSTGSVRQAGPAPNLMPCILSRGHAKHCTATPGGRARITPTPSTLPVP